MHKAAGNEWIFTPEEEASIKRRIEAGETKKAIAASLGIGPKPLARLEKRLGISARAIQHPQLSADLLVELIHLYTQEGWTLMRIARKHEIWIPRLREAFVQAGVTITPVRTDPAKEDAIAHDYVHSGIDTTNLARKHGITEKVIYRLVKERDLIRLVQPVYATARQRMGGKSVYELWVAKYGQDGADRRREKHRALCSKNSSGSNNPMFGKPTPQGSGNGWKGWYQGHFFRSLRELTFMLELEERGVQWVSGEKGAYRVRYVDLNGSERTYAPDYVVLGEAMYEIKPKRLWASPLVTAKRLAAEVLCAKLGIEYRLVDPKLDGDKLKVLHEKGDIKWWGQCEAKFLAYYGLAA